jgi:hypothetical protein
MFLCARGRRHKRGLRSRQHADRVERAHGGLHSGSFSSADVEWGQGDGLRLKPLRRSGSADRRLGVGGDRHAFGEVGQLLAGPAQG